MSTPEYLICMNCETPCYLFEWKDGKLTEILCQACGNEDPEDFITGEDYEALTGGA